MNEQTFNELSRKAHQLEVQHDEAHEKLLADSRAANRRAFDNIKREINRFAHDVLTRRSR